jgi:subtilisin family serine protease
MPADDPLDCSPLHVDIADQIVIGFSVEVGNLVPAEALVRIQRVRDALHKSGFPTELLNQFVPPSSGEKVPFVVALVRLEQGTFAELQAEIAGNGKLYPDIGWVERNATVKPAAFNDVWFKQKQQWALARLGVTDRWTVSPPGPQVAPTILAIVDSGLRRAGGGVPADIGLVEPVGGLDFDGHGTRLAGTMAARPDNGVGIASPIDPTWNIRLLPLRFFGPLDPPSAYKAAIAIALAAAYSPNVRVINASWHVAPGGGGILTLGAIIQLVMGRRLVVMAAGNDGTDNDAYPTWPASFGGQAPFQGNVLTVLATDFSDSKAFFSNFGPNSVDLGAPGLRVLTTGRYLVNPPRYAAYSGTSAAAAHASAAAALVFALNPGWTPVDVIQHLIASAEAIPRLQVACITGRRLHIGRAVYGPLRVTAPLPGVVLPVNVQTNITWAVDYNNAKFTHVKIEFSPTGTDPYITLSPPPLSGWSIGAPFPWTPAAPTATGRIRITPMNGNFPAVSKVFAVA